MLFEKRAAIYLFADAKVGTVLPHFCEGHISSARVDALLTIQTNISLHTPPK